jgi:cytochrome c oxidase subunit 4
LIGLILVAITAAEVGVYYLDISRGLLVGTLAIMSVTKFTIVVLWFMHLKFDSQLFRYLFLLGLLGAIALFTIVLAVEAAKVV